MKTPQLSPSQPGSLTYWHVYARGRRGRRLFYDESDYIVFLALLKQHLRLQRLTAERDRVPPGRRTTLTLYAYSLAESGFQLLLKENGQGGGMDRLGHALTISYESFFRAKYGSKTQLFSDVHKSTKVENAPLLVELSAAMHRLSRPGWRRSSLPYYGGQGQLDWLQTGDILKLAGGIKPYLALVTPRTVPSAVRRQ